MRSEGRRGDSTDLCETLFIYFHLEPGQYLGGRVRRQRWRWRLETGGGESQKPRAKSQEAILSLLVHSEGQSCRDEERHVCLSLSPQSSTLCNNVSFQARELSLCSSLLFSSLRRPSFCYYIFCYIFFFASFFTRQFFRSYYAVQFQFSAIITR